MTGSPAQEQALVELGRARGLRPDPLVARALTGAELARLQEVARRSRFSCPRGCVALTWAELEQLPALRCPRCGLALAGELGSGSGPLVAGSLCFETPHSGAQARSYTAPSENASRFQTEPGPTGSYPAAGASGATAAPEVRTIGSYQVLRELGRGSFGVVYLVKRPGLDRQFALKVLLETARDPELLARFRLEGAVASKLEHPGIVGVIDVGQQGDVPYLVMEYCPGMTLRARLREGGRMSPREAARVVLDIARAVAFAHDRGVIHRDLKPANIILEENTGRPKVTDFGLARDRSLARSMTRTGDVVGSPLYAAPEQLRGERDIDLRVDVYGLGVMLYECLTGQLPFNGTNLVELADSVLRRPLRPLRALDGRIPAALDEACMRALARDRGERSASAHVLAGELEEFLQVAEEQVGAPSRAPRARRPLVLVAAALAVTLALALGITLGRGPADAPPAVTTTAAPPPSPPPTPPPAPPPPPPVATREVAPDAEVEPLLGVATRIIRWNERRGLDDEALALLTAGAPGLRERYPRDSRAVFLAAYAGLFGGEDELRVRRAFVRATWLRPPLGASERELAARLSHALGFQRAACDALEPSFAEGRVPHGLACLCLLQVYMKSAPPVQDADRSIAIARLALEARERDARDGDGLMPPTWDLHANLGELLRFKGDRAGAARAYEGARRSTRLPERMEQFAQMARALPTLDERALARGHDVPGRMVSFFFGVTRFLGVLVEHARAADGGREVEVARSLGALARDERPERASLLLVAAARALDRRGDLAGALAALEAAASLTLPPEAVDVRALVARCLARALLGRHPDRDLVRAEALAKEAAAPLPGVEAVDDPRTPGERADAWVLVGLARRERGDQVGVREAVREAERLAPFDRRELDLLSR